MTDLGTQITAVFAAGVVAVGGVAGATSTGSGSPTQSAIVIDAAQARDGRDLLDQRLQDSDAEVRVPRTPEEARTSVRYLAELGKRVVVAGPQATAAAESTGIEAVQAGDLAAAMTAAARAAP
jgi:hypothetical protein